MTGNQQELDQLYRELIGEAIPCDLSNVWIVGLGEISEPLNLRFYTMKSKHLIGRQGEVVVHPIFDWACATLDAYDYELRCPIECKLTRGREPIDPVLLDRYHPQAHMLMECTGALQCALSIAHGAINEPVIEYIPYDAAYGAELMARGERFMNFNVAKKIPPVDFAAVSTPAPPSVEYDMRDSNRWCSEAFAWLENKGPADRCKEAEQILKSLVPPDAKKCFGNGIRITRDRAGRLSLREDK